MAGSLDLVSGRLLLWSQDITVVDLLCHALVVEIECVRCLLNGSYFIQAS